ncbi:hypothetical protein H4R24_003945 [Coemansia sp. RSA 988]|nr:hypothetical protein H4R24_003945 [Coemansia sp. RSA 988]
MVFTTSVSNISLIMANGHQLKVKNFVLHAAVIDYLIISLDIIYGWLRTDLTELVKPDQLLLDLTFTEAEAPPSAAGVIIERLLCGFPNLRYMFFSDMNTIYGSLISKMLCYTVSGYPDIARPANAVFDSAVVHDFNRIALGVDIDETAVQTMSPGYFQWLGGIPIPYQYLRYLANQIDAVHENMGGFKQYLLYFPSLLYINSAGNITSYEMYQVLDNGMMYAEDASPYEIQDENL